MSEPVTTLALLGAAPVRTSPFPLWPTPNERVESAVREVVRSGHWWQSGGGVSERLEERLARWFGAARVVCVANGTVALEIGLRGLGIGPGDEVLVPATTFVSTASAVVAVGALPVSVDVDAATWNLDVTAAQDRLSPRTRALVAVHLAGQPVDLTACRRFCDAHGLALVEDSAQAIGARWAEARVGTAGDLTTFSFQAAKLLPGGDGGAVLIPGDAALAERVERLANCGRPRGSSRYDHRIAGTNGRISEFAAAVVLAQIDDYETLWAVRDRTAVAAAAFLPPEAAVLTHPEVSRHDHYMFLIRMPETLLDDGISNAAFAAALTAEGLPAQVLYPAWPALPAFARLDDPRPEVCPAGREAARRGIWLHHRMLLDPRFGEDLATAWERIMGAPEELAAWQRDAA
ncbi:DegT/DnrJ/EryC1/StrS aminotransferase family protein [Nonomuraea jabiensis]|uniref:3-amino-5-hydroxybenzoate synthase n=1 Tax=Nonomuraea jabiensis TaxID=882448 RepID=A0A7W9G0J9_9ACTN|nr:DegT/DnrJ/EryC1/StrS family aminotransferase [Nonomuraea jabiensis]MBB5774975.1 3-amino-5-hydroxybenzoate synthase [Nonomuraea jabiensis]